MIKKLNCIMLVDDNVQDNFFHERIIRKCDAAKEVVVMESGLEALDYLRKHKALGETHPDLIFLDINMPGMNGWEFLEDYGKLEKKYQSEMVVVMLTTSDNPDDLVKASSSGVLAGFKTKPLTKEMLADILANWKE
jgi:CheY-like chemotaxis protein